MLQLCLLLQLLETARCQPRQLLHLMQSELQKNVFREDAIICSLMHVAPEASWPPWLIV